MQRRPHPSGRPIRRPTMRGVGRWNLPPDGPMTPRLRTPLAGTSAIGFLVPSLSESEADQLRREMTRMARPKLDLRKFEASGDWVKPGDWIT